MMRLAEKRCEVGGNCVNKVGQLKSQIVLKVVAIRTKGVQTQNPDTPHNAAIDHFLFVIAQLNTGVLLGQSPDERKVFVRHRKFAFIKSGLFS